MGNHNKHSLPSHQETVTHCSSRPFVLKKERNPEIERSRSRLLPRHNNTTAPAKCSRRHWHIFGTPSSGTKHRWWFDAGQVHRYAVLLGWWGDLRSSWRLFGLFRR
ncbi:hypothetical protein JTE90_024792 [Oedothorax gibbosus]|uniref:Uncharacterized protein n=1 Tax=Oedothorax gibbosus TaxID=931172 RepID=A0AAV6TZM7_9ARAC|nr:hypothetical protein JTE90_024792 [Oedothorax gibbosus]